MPKARDSHLNEQEFEAIEAAIRRDKRPEVRQRYAAIRLLHFGHKPKEVAQLHAVSIPTITVGITVGDKRALKAWQSSHVVGDHLKLEKNTCRQSKKRLRKAPRHSGMTFPCGRRNG